MCGICGIISKKANLSARTLFQMNSLQRHRGPDDEGYFFIGKEELILGGKDTPYSAFKSSFPYAPQKSIEEYKDFSFSIGIANRRLSIIDLSEKGHQPMCDKDKTIWISHNGEIYNYKEIRYLLEKKGYEFISNTDTEVIIYAYKEFGIDFLNKLNGMWGFVIYDKLKNKIILARDRFGIKPLYFYYNEDLFIFASEIKSIIGGKFFNVKVNEEIVDIYLKNGFINYNYETFFKGIEQVLPGHFLEFDIHNFKYKTIKYYNIPIETSCRYSEEESTYILKNLLIDSIKLRLISDVPVGTCLSGGIDSSTIVCIIDKLLKGKKSKFPNGKIQKTFSARYYNLEYDEGKYIESVINFADIDANFIYPTEEQFKNEIEDLIWYQEEPFSNTSVYAQWCVFKIAKENGVSVVLDGQGSDELLAGYTGYKYPFLAELLRQFKIITYFKEIYCLKQRGDSVERCIRKSIRDFIPEEFLHIWLKIIKPGKIFQPIDKNIQDKLLKYLYRDFTNNLLVFLKYEDRNSMAHSVESRLPFMDYRIVNFLFSLPSTFKFKNGYSKWILRESVKGLIPEEVRLRRDKIGFLTPENTWFKIGMKNFIDKIFTSESFFSRKYFNAEFINKIWKLYLENKINKSDLIWRYLNLELWLRKFID